MLQCSKCGNTPPHPRARFCPTCGAMLAGAPDPADPWIGRVIGDRYRILSTLGAGGMGRIYLAEQQMGTVSRKVAVKALHRDLAADPMLAKRFNREAEIVVRLGHPNTITFYDFGQTPDGTLYIVMEYINGESLARLVKKGPLSPERAAHILDQVCCSLHEAHEVGIVHRDLKPENIILTQRISQTDFVKVLDFGIAKRTEPDADSLQLTRAGVVLGTPPYMSPEQFAGQPLDRRSDIYSLGVMAYEMLTGRLPFQAETPWEWATKHLSASPAAFDETEVGRLIPAGCRSAVKRALAKHPEHRPATTLEFIEEFRDQAAATRPHVDESAAASPPRSIPPSSFAPLPKTQKVQVYPGARRRRWGVLLAAIVILAALLGVAAALAAVHFGILTRPSWLETIPLP